MAETFAAWIITLNGLAGLAAHLIENHAFSYVLLGKLQSDPLEGRFGMYRQLNGASFFVSVHQVLQAEKKIRVLNQMQLNTVYAAFDPQSSTNASNIDSSTSNVNPVDVTWLCGQLQLPDGLDWELSETDENLIFFTASCIGHSVGRVRKCTDCKALLVEGDVNDELHANLQKLVTALHGGICDNVKHLFELVDCGGLAKPTPFNFAISSYVFFCYH